MASPSSLTLSPQTALHYTSILLSQRGHNALPYMEDMKFLIRQHLMNLMEDFSSLRARPAPFVRDDGTSANLLQVAGTIPITFRGTPYNTPIIIWLMEAYPRSPPRVFVSPTENMIIKRFHKNVDASGRVSIPYLESWLYPRSNLVDLVHALSFIFSQDPPLLSKPSALSSHPQRVSRVSTAASPVLGALPNRLSTPGTSPSRSQLQTPSASPHRRDSPGSVLSRHDDRENGRSKRMDNSSELFRRNSIKTLVERLKLDTSELRMECEKDLDKLFVVQTQLKQRGSEQDRAVSEFQQEKESLTHKLSILHTNTGLLEGWLEGRGDSSLDVHVDDAFQPCDSFAKQILETMSNDFALEDVLYSLEKAVQEDLLRADVYLKQVRQVAREQFLYRAAIIKLEAAQQHSRVSNVERGHDV